MPDLALGAVQAWRVYGDEIDRRLGTAFARAQTRTRALASRAGLLRPADRQHSGPRAELRGAEHPYGFQHLLGRAAWAPEARRARRRASVPAALHAPEAVGGTDATGLRTNGLPAAGGARPDRGTAGRMEDCPSGVSLA